MANTMPYSTYTTKRMPFVGNPELRRGGFSSTDQVFINFFTTAIKELEGTKTYLEQRAGLQYTASVTPGVGRGIYLWNGVKFFVVGSTLYKDGIALQVLSTSTGTIGFQELVNDVNQKFLLILDGTSGWVVQQDLTISKITDSNFPTPHVVQAASMDGYIFVAKVGTSDVYNCNLINPFVWTPGDFISAETYPDNIIALCRQNNYVVAIGEQTIEYFYDTGVFPGTPLARNSAALHQVGTPAASTVAQLEEEIFFVGQTQLGGRTVWMMEGFTPNEISTAVVRQSLDGEGTNISNAKAYCIRSKGHKFYVLNLTSTTWVYDFDLKVWHQWANYTGAAKFPCDYACDGPGSPTMLDRTTGYVYSLQEGLSKDSISPTTQANITSIAISDKTDFGTMNSKFMSRLAVVCDVPSGNNVTSCTLYWTDDDYQTYSSGRVIPISSTMPSITQLGRFRRRAFKLVYADAFPMRLEGFEVDINMGTQ